MRSFETLRSKLLLKLMIKDEESYVEKSDPKNIISVNLMEENNNINIGTNSKNSFPSVHLKNILKQWYLIFLRKKAQVIINII